MSKYLSREGLLASQSSLSGWRTEEVEIPELGEDAVVLVRELSATEKDDVSFGMARADGTVDMRLARGMGTRVVAYGAIDDEGKRIFSNKDGRNEVGQLPSTIIDRLAGAILRLSKIAEEVTTAEVVCPECLFTFLVTPAELLAEAQKAEIEAQEAEAAKNE